MTVSGQRYQANNGRRAIWWRWVFSRDKSAIGSVIKRVNPSKNKLQKSTLHFGLKAQVCSLPERYYGILQFRCLSFVLCTSTRPIRFNADSLRFVFLGEDNSSCFPESHFHLAAFLDPRGAPFFAFHTKLIPLRRLARSCVMLDGCPFIISW